MRLDNPAATARLGALLTQQPNPAVWLLSGRLGSGKTTLIRGALRRLGVRQRVASPTFALVHDYHTRGRWRQVRHIDAYRIKHPSEERALEIEAGWERAGGLVVVEWPERLRRRWPRPHLKIHLSHRGSRRMARWRIV